MVSLAAAAPAVAAAFVASLVEAVEAFTIVLAVSVVRGPRPAILGSLGALGVLALGVALLGRLITRAPVHGLQIVIGVLLLVFGLGWLRKAVLRAGGALASHDETAAFTRETDALRAQVQARANAAEALAAIAAFKAVLLEGTEVVFIVLAVGARPGLLAPAAVGAVSACVLVFALGLVLRAPLARIPENALKFAVGGILTGFGVFWCCEGLGAPMPGGDVAIAPLIIFYLLAGLALSAAIRARRSGAAS